MSNEKSSSNQKNIPSDIGSKLGDLDKENKTEDIKIKPRRSGGRKRRKAVPLEENAAEQAPKQEDTPKEAKTVKLEADYSVGSVNDFIKNYKEQLSKDRNTRIEYVKSLRKDTQSFLQGIRTELDEASDQLWDLLEKVNDDLKTHEAEEKTNRKTYLEGLFKDLNKNVNDALDRISEELKNSKKDWKMEKDVRVKFLNQLKKKS